MLDKDDKFFCDHCCCLQEAQKRLLIKQVPSCMGEEGGGEGSWPMLLTPDHPPCDV